MTDDLGIFEETPVRERNRPGRPKARPKRKRRRTIMLAFIVVAALLLVGGVWYGFNQLSEFGGYDDFAGAGERDVVVEVVGGDSTGTIATRLTDEGIVASSKAFLAAAANEAKIRSIQPGYYVMRTKISGKDAVAKIVNPAAKVGNLQIRAGTQFDDIAKGETVTPGVLSLMSKASCATLDGKETCVSVEQLRQVAETGDLAALGVPEWAVGDAARVEPQRRLEGLVAPEVYEIKPGTSAQEVWKQVLTSSSARMQSYGMPKIAEATGFTPYQVLTMGSLVQREAVSVDFAKVARVTYNRLAKGMRLEYDSTINYVLDRPTITTNSSDRDRAGAYNTYKNVGLIPTPIAAVSKEALGAAAQPAEGTWLYFVRCQKDGTSCFGDTYDQHKANIKLAQDNDAY
ncbi:MAG: endolytic transglycosylase MltG [Actinomycetota bacterium]|nr:endolytic transglycosylase MltG [Actinomycetota bacterium]